MKTLILMLLISTSVIGQESSEVSFGQQVTWNDNPMESVTILTDSTLITTWSKVPEFIDIDSIITINVNIERCKPYIFIFNGDTIKQKP